MATTVLVTREKTAQPAAVDVPTAHASAPVSDAGRVLDRGTDSMLRVLHDEIDRAHPNASPAPTDAGTTERFIERDADGITYIEPRITRFEPDAASPTGPVPGHAVAHHLVYRHGLKLVHPDELYPERPPVFPAAGVPASQEDRGTNGATSTGNTVRYLDLLDEALGQYADGNTEGALDALVFLLQQYPQDVNARFYAGQCYYHLGLLARARDQFARVLASPVDAFDEEAAWYGALVAVQVDGAAAARPLFQRIAGEGGFYADRAKAYLK